MFTFKWFERESIQFFATIVGGSFALFAYLKKIENSRDQEAGKFIERWNKPDLRSIVDRTRPFVERTQRSEDFARPKYSSAGATPTQTQLRGDIITILGLFEEIAISVQLKQATEDRLKEFFGEVIPSGYDGFQDLFLRSAR
jgi:hypothetical protein